MDGRRNPDFKNKSYRRELKVEFDDEGVPDVTETYEMKDITAMDKRPKVDRDRFDVLEARYVPNLGVEVVLGQNKDTGDIIVFDENDIFLGCHRTIDAFEKKVHDQVVRLHKIDETRADRNADEMTRRAQAYQSRHKKEKKALDIFLSDDD